MVLIFWGYFKDKLINMCKISGTDPGTIEK